MRIPSKTKSVKVTQVCENRIFLTSIATELLGKDIQNGTPYTYRFENIAR